jgi:hypothetical protein
MSPACLRFRPSAAGDRGTVVADGRRDLVYGRSRKLRQFPSASRPKALNGFEVWLVSITMTKFRLSPTTVHAEIACGSNTIFDALDIDPKRQFASNKVPVLYCGYEAATKPLHQAIEFSKLAMFRSRPICGCVESFLLWWLRAFSLLLGA